jgi:hypothetical protein
VVKKLLVLAMIVKLKSGMSRLVNVNRLYLFQELFGQLFKLIMVIFLLALRIIKSGLLLGIYKGWPKEK